MADIKKTHLSIADMADILVSAKQWAQDLFAKQDKKIDDRVTFDDLEKLFVIVTPGEIDHLFEEDTK